MVDAVLAPPPETVSPSEYQAIDEKPDEVTDRWIPAEVYLAEDGSIVESAPDSQVESPPRPPPTESLPLYEAWFQAYTHPSVNTFWRLANDPRASLWRAYLWIALASLTVASLRILVHLPELLSLNAANPSGPVPMVLVVPYLLLPAAFMDLLVFALLGGIVYLVSRLLRGKGSYVSHVYAFAASLLPWS